MVLTPKETVDGFFQGELSAGQRMRITAARRMSEFNPKLQGLRLLIEVIPVDSIVRPSQFRQFAVSQTAEIARTAKSYLRSESIEFLLRTEFTMQLLSTEREGYSCAERRMLTNASVTQA